MNEKITDVKTLVNVITRILADAGVPYERMPTPTYISSKVFSDWIDRSKIESWIEQYVKAEATTVKYLQITNTFKAQPKKVPKKREIGPLEDD